MAPLSLEGPVDIFVLVREVGRGVRACYFKYLDDVPETCPMHIHKHIHTHRYIHIMGESAYLGRSPPERGALDPYTYITFCWRSPDGNM